MTECRVLLLPAMNPKDMPFDGKRMFWGGFKQIVALRRAAH